MVELVFLQVKNKNFVFSLNSLSFDLKCWQLFVKNVHAKSGAKILTSNLIIWKITVGTWSWSSSGNPPQISDLTSLS